MCAGITRCRGLNGELYAHKFQKILYLMIQICSGITSGRVHNGELYGQRLQKLNAVKCR